MYNYSPTYRSKRSIPDISLINRALLPQFEEVEDDAGAIDLEQLTPEQISTIQSQLPQQPSHGSFAPDSASVETTILPYDPNFKPHLTHHIGGIRPQYRKLFGVRYPEFKMDTCKKTYKTPFGKIRIKYPCLKTRESEINVYAFLTFPTDLEQFVKDQLNKCLDQASVAATTSALNTFYITPGTPIERVLAGISVGYQTLQSTFLACVQAIPSWDTIRDNIDYGIDHEEIKINDWH